MNLYGIDAIQGGATALVAVVVLLVLTGRLVPRRTLEDLRHDRDARLAELATERDTWRHAQEVSEQGRRAAEDQVDELLELSRTAGHLLTELRGRAEESGHALAPPPAP